MYISRAFVKVYICLSSEILSVVWYLSDMKWILIASFNLSWWKSPMSQFVIEVVSCNCKNGCPRSIIVAIKHPHVSQILQIKPKMFKHIITWETKFVFLLLFSCSHYHRNDGMKHFISIIAIIIFFSDMPCEGTKEESFGIS